MIHVYNKNETALRGRDHDIIQDRTNIILMGDSLGDASMSNGNPDTANILKIAFLSAHVCSRNRLR